MKFACSILMLAVWLLVAPASHAATFTNLLNLTVLSSGSTNNSTTVALGQISIPSKLFLFQSTGITNGSVTAVTHNIQVSFDGTNYTTVSTVNPSTTNAVVDTVTPAIGVQTIYLRDQVLSTGTNGVSVMLQTSQ